MSCRPAIMPPTKSYSVRRLDSTEQDVTLLKKATGSDCLDKVSSVCVYGREGCCSKWLLFMSGVRNSLLEVQKRFC